MLGRLRSGVLDLAEICRFPNEPIREHASVHWDILRLWREMQRGLERLERDVAPPRQHRRRHVGLRLRPARRARRAARQPVSLSRHADRRHHGGRLRAGSARADLRDHRHPVPAFNTLYQLVAAARSTPRMLDAATSFGTIPDILNYWLTGELRAEYTSATTTQMVDARARAWARDLLRELDLPTALLPSWSSPGRCSAGSDEASRRRSKARRSWRRRVTIRVRRSRRCQRRRRAAFLSSGTWSLLGTEVPRADHHAAALEANFTNEGGVCGTTRLLKNIGGLWLLQSCRRGWAREGQHYDYAELMDAAGDERHAFSSLFDPDDPVFLHPPDMAGAIARVLPSHRAARADRSAVLHPRDPREPGLQVPRGARIAGGADRRRDRARSRSSAADRAIGC